MGDIDNSGHVNVIDLLYLADSWSRTFGNAGYDVNCDLSGDNAVDIIDLLTLVENWGL